jgi:hypothetical protein
LYREIEEILIIALVNATVNNLIPQVFRVLIKKKGRFNFTLFE